MHRNKFKMAFFLLCLIGGAAFGMWRKQAAESTVQVQAQASAPPPYAAPVAPYTMGDVFARLAQ